MFCVGKNVYATQFHPEGDGQGFTVRINAYKQHGFFHKDKADELVAAVNREDTTHTHEILRRFVERYAG
jgi:GMP synthase (glutamine-hydrolysing)